MLLFRTALFPLVVWVISLVADVLEVRPKSTVLVAVHGMIAHKRPYAELQVTGRPTVGHRTGSVADSPPTSNLPGGVFGQPSRVMVVTIAGTYTFEGSTFEVSFPAMSVLNIRAEAPGYKPVMRQLKAHYERTATLDVEIPLEPVGPVEVTPQSL